MKLTLTLFHLLAVATYAATYSVPVPTELQDHARWNISGHAIARVNGDDLQVSYQLPADITGEGNGNFEFTGKITSSFVNVSGAGVYGACMLARSKPLTCMLKYPEMAIDTTSVDKSLATHFSGNEFDIRKRVARIFSADPAGLLSVEIAQ